jgi:hypothetical protein
VLSFRGAESIRKYIDAMARATGVSLRFAYGIQIELHIADNIMGNSRYGIKPRLMFLGKRILSKIDRILNNILRSSLVLLVDFGLLLDHVFHIAGAI